MNMSFLKFRTSLRLSFYLVAAFAFSLTACSETKFAAQAFKNLAGYGQDSDNPIQYDPGMPYKLGGPYQIAGRWYVPRLDMGYTREGIASWYGPDFHGKKTANGEIYNKFALTAAHQTLPLPTIVRVTNLENGKRVDVRINDRGPFVGDRIIDLSYAAAKKIDMDKRGLAKVRVEVLQNQTLALYQNIQNAPHYSELFPKPSERPFEVAGLSKRPHIRPNTINEVVSNVLENESRPNVLDVTKEVSAKSEQPLMAQKIGTYYIQTASFIDAENAHAHSVDLQKNVRGKPIQVREVAVNGKPFYRVQIGPFTSQEEANLKLAQISSSGRTKARIVTE